MRHTLQSVAGLPELVVDVAVDRTASAVTLHMLEYDAERIGALVEHLAHKLGVRFDDSLFEHTLSHPLYGLVINLAGRHHPVRLGRLPDGRLVLGLGDPDSAYLERCMLAIDQTLQALHQIGIEAVVQGIDDHGRPKPYEGFLHLFADARGELQEEQVIATTQVIAQACGVELIALGFNTAQVKLEPHFAWDADAARVERRWTGS